MQHNVLKYSLLTFLLFALIAVRMYEAEIFYDPLLDYFKNSNHTNLPSMNLTDLYINVFLRFMINLLLSVLIVKVLFNEKAYVKFTIIIGILGFVILLPLYAYMLNHNLNFGEMIFFYVRRFLIQPMFLIILIPCFYYQEIRNKKATQI